VMHRPDLLWQRVARSEGRLRRERAPVNEQSLMNEREEALANWRELGQAFASSQDPEDRALAHEVERFLRAAPVFAGRLAVDGSLLRGSQDRQHHEHKKKQRNEDRAQDTGGPER